MKRIAAMVAIGATLSMAGCASTGEKTELADNDQVCRRVEEMGSNLPKKICMTRGEWEAVDQATNDESRAFLDKANRNVGGAPSLLRSSGM